MCTLLNTRLPRWETLPRIHRYEAEGMREVTPIFWTVAK
jgi:hypothetical protein